ncbi:MAG: 50S ribosomal protein L28 [Candidatus Paceibacterota bacterium]
MKQCEICGKGSLIMGHRVKLRGKYNPVSRTRKYPNLQKTKNAAGVRVLACTSCIKKLGKVAA